MLGILKRNGSTLGVNESLEVISPVVFFNTLQEILDDLGNFSCGKGIFDGFAQHQPTGEHVVTGLFLGLEGPMWEGIHNGWG